MKNKLPKPKNSVPETISREWEDFVEQEEEEEMNELYEKCHQIERSHSTVPVRDRLDRIHSLVQICCIALNHQDWKGQEYVQKNVAAVLCDYIGPEIQKAEEELRCI